MLKKQCYEIISESDLSDGDKVFLAHVVNTYLSQERLKGGTKEIMEQLVEYEEDWLEMTMNRRLEFPASPPKTELVLFLEPLLRGAIDSFCHSF